MKRRVPSSSLFSSSPGQDSFPWRIQHRLQYVMDGVILHDLHGGLAFPPAPLHNSPLSLEHSHHNWSQIFHDEPPSAHLVLGPVISSNHIPLALPQAASLLQDKGLSWQPGGADGRGIGLSTECGSSVCTSWFHKGHDHGGSWQMRPWPGLFSGAAGLKPDQSAHVPCCSSREESGGRGGSEGKGEAHSRAHVCACVDKCVCRHVRVDMRVGGCGLRTGSEWECQRRMRAASPRG